MRLSWIVLALAGCVSSTQATADGDASSTSADDDDGEPESERERLVRVATEKREQCEKLGYAIETAESGGQEFVNLNDERALTRLARARNQTAERIEGMKLSSDALLPIREDYVKLNREMAEALSQTATTRVNREKKASLGRYREHEKNVETIIDRFNGACDGS